MLADDFEPWSAKKTSILSRYTTSEKISITTVSARVCVHDRESCKEAFVCMYEHCVHVCVLYSKCVSNAVHCLSFCGCTDHFAEFSEHRIKGEV